MALISLSGSWSRIFCSRASGISRLQKGGVCIEAQFNLYLIWIISSLCQTSKWRVRQALPLAWVAERQLMSYAPSFKGRWHFPSRNALLGKLLNSHTSHCKVPSITAILGNCLFRRLPSKSAAPRAGFDRNTEFCRAQLWLWEKHVNNRHVLKCDFPENVGNCLYFSWGSETQLGVMAEQHWRKLPRSFRCGVVPVQGTESSLHGCDPEREGKSCHSCGMSYPAGRNAGGVPAFFIAQDLDLSPPNSSVPGILTQLGTDCPAQGGAGSHVEL